MAAGVAGSEKVVSRVLRDFSNEELSKVLVSQESFSNHCFFEPNIEKQTNTLHTEVLGALTYLEGGGYLTSDESVARYCVECFGVSLILSGSCPGCGSRNLIFGRVFKHGCGHTGLESSFGRADRWVCPGCGQGIYDVRKECEIMPNSYGCTSCGSIFERFVTRYVCADCGAAYPEGEEPRVRLTTYQPTPLLEGRKKDIQECYSAMDRIGSYLSHKGFKVDGPVILETPQADMYWDVVARRGGREDGETRIGIEVAPLLRKLDANVMENMLAKRRTSGLTWSVIIATVEPQERGSDRLLRGRVVVIDPRELSTKPATEIKEKIAVLL